MAVVEWDGLFARDPHRRLGAKHQDAKRLVDLFKRHPNVKLCLSGHLHLVEKIEYAGVTYISSGAVCGNWWHGDHHKTDEGYLIADFFNDGSFESQYVAYGWKPRA